MNRNRQNKKTQFQSGWNLSKNVMKRFFPPFLLFALLLILWLFILMIYIMTLASDSPDSMLQIYLLIIKTLYLLLLPLPDLVYLLVFAVRKRRKRGLPSALVPKTENRELMGFCHDVRFKVPPTVFLTLCGILFFLPDRKYPIAALLFLWLLLQFWEGRQLSKSRDLEKKKQLREDVLKIYHQEKNMIAKSLHYALIMEDDSGLIPSTFGNGNHPVSNVLLFDHKTEVEPFLAEDPEKNYAQNWVALYVCPDFFIYAFDSAKYTAKELEQKCIKAVTFSRFPVSKPLYILILGFSAELTDLIQKYAWLPEVSIQILDSWNMLQIQDIVNDYIDRKQIPWYKSVEEEQDYAESLGTLAYNIYKNAVSEYMPMMKTSLINLLSGSDALKYSYFNYMSGRASYLTLPLEQLDSSSWNYCYHYLNSLTVPILYYIQKGELSFYHSVSNFYVCGFLPNIFRWKEMSIGVMAEFEYAHLAMRFVHYYLFSKHTSGPIEEYFAEDKNLGPAILELTKPDDPFYTALHREMDLSDPLLHNALLILKELFGIEHTEKTLDFPHLTNILRLSRNITRGHGAIRSGMQDQIWFALYVLLNLLNEMLCIGFMEIELDGEQVRVSYREDKRWYWHEQYAIVREHVPLLLHGISKKNRLEYINYYKGNAAVPEITVLSGDKAD